MCQGLAFNIAFDEVKLLEALRPDVLVKGGDSTPETIVGRELVELFCGKGVNCLRLEELSTIDMAKKIDERWGDGGRPDR